MSDKVQLKIKFDELKDSLKFEKEYKEYLKHTAKMYIRFYGEDVYQDKLQVVYDRIKFLQEEIIDTGFELPRIF